MKMVVSKLWWTKTKVLFQDLPTLWSLSMIKSSLVTWSGTWRVHLNTWARSCTTSPCRAPGSRTAGSRVGRGRGWVEQDSGSRRDQLWDMMVQPPPVTTPPYQSSTSMIRNTRRGWLSLALIDCLQWSKLTRDNSCLTSNQLKQRREDTTPTLRLFMRNLNHLAQGGRRRVGGSEIVTSIDQSECFVQCNMWEIIDAIYNM